MDRFMAQYLCVGLYLVLFFVKKIAPFSVSSSLIHALFFD